MLDLLTIRDEMDSYLGHLRREGTSRATVLRIRCGLVAFLDWVERGNLRNVLRPTRKSIRRYEQYLRANRRRFSPRSAADALETITAFYEWIYLFGSSVEKTAGCVRAFSASSSATEPAAALLSPSRQRAKRWLKRMLSHGERVRQQAS